MPRLCYSSHARCVWHTLNSELNALEFPNLSKFVYAEQPGWSASSGVDDTLVKKAAQSEKLRVLHVGLSGF